CRGVGVCPTACARRRFPNQASTLLTGIGELTLLDWLRWHAVLRAETLAVRSALERLPSTREARHDPSDRDVHDPCHFLIRERLHFAQDKAFSPCDWKRVKRVVQCRQILPPRQRRLGTGARIGYVYFGSIFIGRTHFAAERNLHSAPLGPE